MYVADFEITKREVIVSVSIAAAMLIIGLLINSALVSAHNDKVLEYNQALQITDTEMFKYCMMTDAGNALIYGDLTAIDTVSYDGVDGAYIYIKKVTEKHTMHTRTYTDSKGKTHTETYYTWDVIGSEDKHCERVAFLDVPFSYGEIDMPSCDYVGMKMKSAAIRYVYYGIGDRYTGTMFAKLSGNSVRNTTFYDSMGIEAVLDHIAVNHVQIAFWIVWIVLIIATVIGFCYLENNWLNTD